MPSPPELLRFHTTPVFSKSLLGPSGVRGTSRGVCVIDERGTVRCRLLEAPEGAESVALQVMEDREYSPARDALGRPVVVWHTIIINATRADSLVSLFSDPEGAAATERRSDPGPL